VSTNADKAWKYRLAPGTQVREEDFGLLFYTQSGPRLYFLPAGELLTCEFFRGEMSLDGWIKKGGDADVSIGRMGSLQTALSELSVKGVIIEF
jgi:putative mycofactocin binding protein MftB